MRISNLFLFSLLRIEYFAFVYLVIIYKYISICVFYVYN